VGLRTKELGVDADPLDRDPRTGQQDLWFMSGENGFQILRFTNGAYGPRTTAGHVTAPAQPRRATAGTAVRTRAALPATGGSVPLALLALLTTGSALALAGRRIPRPTR
jgi:hypothetical protein